MRLSTRNGREPNSIINSLLHCLIKREPAGYWAAFCLDFTLYAVGHSAAEVKVKLLDQVAEYIREAEVDPVHGPAFLQRRAPMWDWSMFYILSALQWVRRLGHDFSEVTFTPPYRRA